MSNLSSQVLGVLGGGSVIALATLVTPDLAITTHDVKSGLVELTTWDGRIVKAKANRCKDGGELTFLELARPMEGAGFRSLALPDVPNAEIESVFQLGNQPWVTVTGSVDRPAPQPGGRMRIVIGFPLHDMRDAVCAGAPVVNHMTGSIIGFFVGKEGDIPFAYEAIGSDEVIAHLKRDSGIGEKPMFSHGDGGKEIRDESALATDGLITAGGRFYDLSESFFSESTQYILMAGLKLSSFADEALLQMRHLFASCLLVGARRAAFRKNEDYAFVFLAKELGIVDLDSFREFFRPDGRALLSASELDHLVNDIADSVVRGNPVPCAVSPDVDRLLKSAKDLATKTLKRPKDTCIHQRHLLAALLLHACRRESDVARLLLNRMKKSPEILGRELARVWGQLLSDDRLAWAKVFQEYPNPPRQLVASMLMVKSPTGVDLCCASLLTSNLAVAPASCVENDDIQLVLPGHPDVDISNFTLTRRQNFAIFKLAPMPSLKLRVSRPDFSGRVKAGSGLEWYTHAHKRGSQSFYMAPGVGMEIQEDNLLLPAPTGHPKKISKVLPGSPVVSQEKMIGIVVEVGEDGSILAASAKSLAPLVGSATSPNEETNSTVPNSNPTEAPSIDPFIDEMVTQFVDQIARVASDRVPEDLNKLKDQLGVEGQAKAFARVILDREIDSLAIGLFGDWGTGKTFFMRLIERHVRELAGKPMRHIEGFPPVTPAYCEHVVPITFNAWHYIDSNLWASLVTHIFESLARHYVPEGAKEEKIEKERERLLKETQTARKMLETAELCKGEAQQGVIVADKALNKAQNEVESARGSLQIFVRAKITDVLMESEVGKQLENTIKSLELPEGETFCMDVNELAKGIGSVNGKLRVLLRWLTATKSWRILAWVALPPLLALLLQYLGGLIQTLQPHLNGVVAKLAGLGVAIGPVFTKVCHQLDRADKLVDQVIAGKKEFDAGEHALRQKHSAEIQRLEEALAQKEEEQELAEKRVVAAQTRLAEAEQALAGLSLGNRIYDFIDDRCRSNDYQSHLTMISLIRKDFEHLGELLAKSRSGGSENADSSKQHAPIDRVILFIDDLDRCPPERVVEVLEAIHLLLAFPLFVVVVGVDYRWVRNALAVKFREGQAEGEVAYVNPQNYLEKIFQIPYQLPKMETEGLGALVKSLLPATEDRNDPLRSVRDVQPSEPEFAPDSASVEPQPESEADTTEESTGETAVPPPQAGPPTEQEPDGTDEVPEVSNHASQDDAAVMAEAIRIHPKETEFLASLDWIDATPRCLKRITNIYRVIRAHEAAKPDVYGDFIGTSDNEGEFKAVMLLLAIQNAFSDIAPIVFQMMETRRGKEVGGQLYGTWIEWLAGCVSSDENLDDHDRNALLDQGPVRLSKWRILQRGLGRPEIASLGFDMAVFRHWIPVARRYSFCCDDEPKPRTADQSE